MTRMYSKCTVAGRNYRLTKGLTSTKSKDGLGTVPDDRKDTGLRITEGLSVPTSQMFN
ncbi:hypothetical protein BDZ94DRAFT_1261805 [Collybia nuda]|uniref:Uncharacterized protein n=1 Tax=Collybia nuda TaxID=64659 RepID=A0A9P5Y6K6_9AGAR|nr:hypothetical protein BDZ94DRAFT_1261805 [Collybia nuda]